MLVYCYCNAFTMIWVLSFTQGRKQTNPKTLELAVQGAGTLDNKKIRDYLRSNKFDLPYGKGIVFDNKGLPAPFCFTFQTTGGKNRVIWPKEVATTKLVYPRPLWSQ